LANKKQHKKPFAEASLKVGNFDPLTANQGIFFEKYAEGKHQLLLGSAGTGKTFLALLKAFEDLEMYPEYRKVVIVRSAVPTRDIGFLKGDDQEKGAVYERPYRTAINHIFNRGDAYEVACKKEILKFELTSFMRGDTFDNTIMIVDEVQNMTAHEADTVLTRVGMNTKVILCGDTAQQDLIKNNEKNIDKFLKVLKAMNHKFDFTFFSTDDIVRSGLVKDYLKTKERLCPEGY